MRRIAPQNIALAVTVAVALAVLVLVGIALSGLPQRSAEQIQIAVRAIDRAARQCYALEGAYPPGLTYLEDHYGLVLDRERYHYYYEVIGANIRPIIEVQSK